MNNTLIRQIRQISLCAATGILLLCTAPRSWSQADSRHHTHYKVVDTGSFGGPNSHMSIGAHILNNDGMFTGFADTAEADPYRPDGCWDDDCLVARTFRWSRGELRELGVLDAGPNSESNWISENGLIAGDSQNGLLDPLVGAWQIRGVLWRGDEAIDLGTLGGGYNSLARAVNSSGVVVGLSTTLVPDSEAMILSLGLPYAFETRAFRWENGKMDDLGTLGGPDAMALGLNESGQIFGNSYISLEPSSACRGLATAAFLWQKGEMTNLGSFGGTCTNASAINNHGQVVGYSFLSADATFHPFRWDRGKLTDLGTLGGSFGAATTENEAGDIVGWASITNDQFIHAGLWSHGHVTDLGALGSAQCSLPFGINSRKQVVGLVSSDCSFADPSLRAFLWEPGRAMLDLNTLISPTLGIQLTNVAAINDYGEMAAVAFFSDGSHRPVLLIPCGAESGDFDCQTSTSLELSAAKLDGNVPRATTQSNLDSVSMPVSVRKLLTRQLSAHQIGGAKHERESASPSNQIARH